MQVLWFKRDLRLEDNEALCGALAAVQQHGAVLPLYILEPELWQQPDMSFRHYQFLCQSLEKLALALLQHNAQLVIRVGEATDVLKQIHRQFDIQALWSHQESWNGWSYERDKDVAKWARDQQVSWQQPRQHGVIRRLGDRDGWAARWYHQMKQPQSCLSGRITDLHDFGLESEPMPDYKMLGLQHDGLSCGQIGGRPEALLLLDSFLFQRGEGYTKEMSSPVTAFDSCSRLSAHLAFGNVSIREVFQACEERARSLKNISRVEKGKWPSAMRSFSGRLRWHCHFIQKLEDQPDIECRNMHPAYDGLREDQFNDQYFKAWCNGLTGYPMVDACMRALRATGWLNFRMRAMLMSFASYHLWLHWRQPALHLARLFTDYEPGIHYSQAQMQSGTTGINSIRIYNPIKQGMDQDPEGVFIRQWVPELEKMPGQYIHTPWVKPSLMNGYPMPIVDEKAARKQAASQVYGLRKNPDHQPVANAIVKKHASRKRPDKRQPRRKNQGDGDNLCRSNDRGDEQLQLPL